jgi:hypothetical protein
MSDVSEVLDQIEIIKGKEYILRPKAAGILNNIYEEESHYGQLAIKAENNFTLKSECINTSLSIEHMKVIPELIDPDLCRSIIDEFVNDPKGSEHPSVLSALLPIVITENIDRELI